MKGMSRLHPARIAQKIRNAFYRRVLDLKLVGLQGQHSPLSKKINSESMLSAV
jgi:hypothetical protein